MISMLKRVADRPKQIRSDRDNGDPGIGRRDCTYSSTANMSCKCKSRLVDIVRLIGKRFDRINRRRNIARLIPNAGVVKSEIRTAIGMGDYHAFLYMAIGSDR